MSYILFYSVLFILFYSILFYSFIHSTFLSFFLGAEGGAGLRVRVEGKCKGKKSRIPPEIQPAP